MEDNTKEALVPSQDTIATEETAQTNATDAVQIEQPQPEEDLSVKYSKLENDFKSVTGKVSALQREKNRLEQAGIIYEALNKAALSDPEFKKLANKKLAEAGLIDSAEAEELQTSTVPTSQVAPQKVDPALEWARQKKRAEENNQIRFFEQFEKDRPEITAGGDELASLNRQAIGSIASIFIANGVSPADAYHKAYVQLFKAKTDADVDALLNQKSAPNIGGGLGGTPTKTTSGLTPEEKRIASYFKMTDEQYAAGKPKK